MTAKRMAFMILNRRPWRSASRRSLDSLCTSYEHLQFSRCPPRYNSAGPVERDRRRRPSCRCAFFRAVENRRPRSDDNYHLTSDSSRRSATLVYGDLRNPLLSTWSWTSRWPRRVGDCRALGTRFSRVAARSAAQLCGICRSRRSRHDRSAYLDVQPLTALASSICKRRSESCFLKRCSGMAWKESLSLPTPTRKASKEGCPGNLRRFWFFNLIHCCKAICGIA